MYIYIYIYTHILVLLCNIVYYIIVEMLCLYIMSLLLLLLLFFIIIIIIIIIITPVTLVEGRGEIGRRMRTKKVPHPPSPLRVPHREQIRLQTTLRLNEPNSIDYKFTLKITLRLSLEPYFSYMFCKRERILRLMLAKYGYISLTAKHAQIWSFVLLWISS